MTGSTPVRGSREPGVRDLRAGLQTAPLAPAKYTTVRLVEAQAQQRAKDKSRPVFVGLVNPNTQGGVFLNSAPAATYADADNREALLEFLASRLYGGGGAHGIFIKTWGAGLAYSNGLGGSPGQGRLGCVARPL